MSARFDASNDYLDLTAAPAFGTSGFTLVGWVYLSADRDAVSVIARFTASGSERGSLETAADGQTITWGSPDGDLTSSTVMSVGSWYRVGVSIPASGSGTATGTLYTAGAVGSTSSTSGTVTASNDQDLTQVGGDGTNWLDGRISYLRLYETELSQAQIEAEWADSATVVTTGLWADWPLSAARLTDLSRNSRSLAQALGGAVSNEADPPLAGPFTLFSSAEPPAPSLTYGADNSEYTLSTAFTVTASGYELTKGRIYLSSNSGGHTAGDVLAGGDLEFTLYGANASGDGAQTPALFTPVALSSITLDSWVEFTLPTPYALTSGTVYYAAVHLPRGRYSFRSSEFGTAWDRGPLHAPADTDSNGGGGIVRNGAFSTTTGSITPPTGSFNSAWYGIDVVVAETSSGGTLEETVNDTAGLTDSVAFVRSAVESDTAGLTDSVSLARSKVVEDVSGLTDSLSFTRVLTLTDLVGASDALALARSLGIADDLALTDLVSRSEGLNPSDLAGLTDSLSITLRRYVGPLDAAGLTDALSFTRSSTITDTAGVTDSISFIRTVRITDPIGATDSILASSDAVANVTVHTVLAEQTRIVATLGEQRIVGGLGIQP